MSSTPFDTVEEALVRIKHIQSDVTLLEHPKIDANARDLINLINGALNTMYDRIKVLED